MNAGWQYRQVTVERPVKAKTAKGTLGITWAPLVLQPGSPEVAERFPGEVRDVAPGRSESVRLGVETARNQTILRLRWRGDITSEMRVTIHGDVGGDRVMQIVGGPAEIGGRKRKIEIALERYNP